MEYLFVKRLVEGYPECNNQILSDQMKIFFFEYLEGDFGISSSVLDFFKQLNLTAGVVQDFNQSIDSSLKLFNSLMNRARRNMLDREQMIQDQIYPKMSLMFSLNRLSKNAKSSTNFMNENLRDINEILEAIVFRHQNRFIALNQNKYKLAPLFVINKYALLLFIEHFNKTFTRVRIYPRTEQCDIFEMMVLQDNKISV
jgi:hypothetical protein